MARIDDETTDQDALHFAIEREWKRPSVQRDFWRNDGWCKFYVRERRPLTLVDIGPPEFFQDTIVAPIAFAQFDRNNGCIVITTPLDPSYQWIIPLRYHRIGEHVHMIETPLINPAYRETRRADPVSNVRSFKNVDELSIITSELGKFD